MWFACARCFGAYQGDPPEHQRGHTRRYCSAKCSEMVRRKKVTARKARTATTLTRSCIRCGTVFSQIARAGRPFGFCEAHRGMNRG